MLSALSAGYVAANALGLVQGSTIPQTPVPMHVVGLVAGSVLYVDALVETSRAFRRSRTGPVGVTDPARGR